MMDELFVSHLKSLVTVVPRNLNGSTSLTTVLIVRGVGVGQSVEVYDNFDCLLQAELTTQADGTLPVCKFSVILMRPNKGHVIHKLIQLDGGVVGGAVSCEQ